MTRYAYPYGAFCIEAIPNQPQLAHCHSFSAVRGMANGSSVNTYASRLEKAGLLNRERRRIDGRNRVAMSIFDGVCLEFDVVRV